MKRTNATCSRPVGSPHAAPKLASSIIKNVPLLDRLQNAVGEIVLNRPDKMNALNNAMVAELNRCLDRAERERVRAVLIRGEGPAFCAGRDLADARNSQGFRSRRVGEIERRRHGRGRLLGRSENRDDEHQNGGHGNTKTHPEKSNWE